MFPAYATFCRSVAKVKCGEVRGAERSNVYAVLYAESARAFLFEQNTDVELDLSNDKAHLPP